MTNPVHNRGDGKEPIGNERPRGWFRRKAAQRHQIAIQMTLKKRKNVLDHGTKPSISGKRL
jgi:hypothetical protein